MSYYLVRYKSGREEKIAVKTKKKREETQSDLFKAQQSGAVISFTLKGDKKNGY